MLAEFNNVGNALCIIFISDLSDLEYIQRKPLDLNKVKFKMTYFQFSSKLTLFSKGFNKFFVQHTGELLYLSGFFCYVPYLVVTKFLFLGTLHKHIVVKEDISE